jgi:hypothetical protein
MESEDVMNHLVEQARIALDAKGSAERDLAAVVTCPPWRHLAFGLLMGGVVATPAFPLVPRFAILAAILVAIALIIRSDRKRLGVFINGYRRGKTRIVTFGMLAVELGLYWISVRRGLDHDDQLTPLLLALVAVVLATAASVLWQRVFARELGA